MAPCSADLLHLLRLSIKRDQSASVVPSPVEGCGGLSALSLKLVVLCVHSLRPCVGISGAFPGPSVPARGLVGPETLCRSIFPCSISWLLEEKLWLSGQGLVRATSQWS